MIVLREKNHIPSGEEYAWEALTKLKCNDVCHRARVNYDNTSGYYTLKSFGQYIYISLKDKKIFNPSPESYLRNHELRQLSIISILWYLMNAKAIPLLGTLVKPCDLTGGQIYQAGSHVLPLYKIAEKYNNNMQEFLTKGATYGAKALHFGDASLQFYPFPRIPVTLLLWKGDREFSARADILFDATCDLHLPGDIVWSVAMMSIMIML